MKTINVRGDLSDVSAKKAPLLAGAPYALEALRMVKIRQYFHALIDSIQLAYSSGLHALTFVPTARMTWQSVYREPSTYLRMATLLE